MRYLFLGLLLVSLVIVPCVGCNSKQDPRDNPEFNDNPEPAAILEGMPGGLGPSTGPDAMKKAGTKAPSSEKK